LVLVFIILKMSWFLGEVIKLIMIVGLIKIILTTLFGIMITALKV